MARAPGVGGSEAFDGVASIHSRKSHSLMIRFRLLLLSLSLLSGAGCLNPTTTRFPRLFTQESAEMQRREAQIQDPYPDATAGPPTGFRPLNYQKQRSEPQQAKDRFYSGYLKNQFNAQPTTQPVGPGAYGPGNYPGAVQ